MKEDFLHYLWRFKKFPLLELRTTSGEKLQILNTGQYLQRSGPDFFNAQIIIGKQKWAGNIEIHLKSTDWYIHHHHHDRAYDNVILHVVWEHDTVVFRKDNSEIPTLELSPYITTDLVLNYESLLKPKSWIYCERQLDSIDDFTLRNWMERLFLERLERKSGAIITLLEHKIHDWEAVLFNLLAKNFGLNTNGIPFKEMAEALPFSIIRKEHFENANLEALFFGTCGLLEGERQDQYALDLQVRFQFLSKKYNLERRINTPLQFFRLRPDNFPTIRLAQLSMLYHNREDLFSLLIKTNDIREIYHIFNINASDYWQTHYQLDRESTLKRKALTRSFIDLLIINTIIPFRFAYAKYQGKDNIESLIAVLQALPAESNSISDKFSSFGIKPENAFESQSLLELKNDYCSKSRCLECAIGASLLKSL